MQTAQKFDAVDIYFFNLHLLLLRILHLHKNYFIFCFCNKNEKIIDHLCAVRLVLNWLFRVGPIPQFNKNLNDV